MDKTRKFETKSSIPDVFCTGLLFPEINEVVKVTKFYTVESTLNYWEYVARI